MPATDAPELRSAQVCYGAKKQEALEATRSKSVDVLVGVFVIPHSLTTADYELRELCHPARRRMFDCVGLRRLRRGASIEKRQGISFLVILTNMSL